MIRTQTRIFHQINPYKIQKNKIKYVRPWHSLPINSSILKSHNLMAPRYLPSTSITPIKAWPLLAIMSWSEPRYGFPVYLTTPHATQIPETLTDAQILHFHCNNVCTDAIDCTISQMNNPQVEADVSCHCNSLELGDRLEKQLGELGQQEQHLAAKKWDNNAERGGISRSMEVAHLYWRISECYVNMTPNPTCPQPLDTSPFIPCAHGPLKMPKLHDNHHIPPLVSAGNATLWGTSLETSPLKPRTVTASIVPVSYTGPIVASSNALTFYTAKGPRTLGRGLIIKGS